MKIRSRRLVAMVGALILVGVWLVVNPASYEKWFAPVSSTEAESGVEDGGSGADGGMGGAEREMDLGKSGAESETEGTAPLATEVLSQLEVKGRAPKTGYSREEFYSTWPSVDGCSLRQRIIRREFGASAVMDGCDVVAGEFDEPYTGEHLVFRAKAEISKGVQIDHVVALSDAWQKGAQYKSSEERYAMATDPLNLLAVDAAANGRKSDGDAATWLPPNKKFRCQYVARQVSVKYKYGLWVTEAEKEAILQVLSVCPGQRVVGV